MFYYLVIFLYNYAIHISRLYCYRSWPAKIYVDFLYNHRQIPPPNYIVPLCLIIIFSFLKVFLAVFFLLFSCGPPLHGITKTLRLALFYSPILFLLCAQLLHIISKEDTFLFLSFDLMFVKK